MADTSTAQYVTFEQTGSIARPLLPHDLEGTTMLTLYYSPGTASLCVHHFLIELGLEHRLELVDFASKAQKSPEYLKLNPRGVVPTLVVDGESMVESGAILMWLAEQDSRARFVPGVIPAG